MPCKIKLTPQVTYLNLPIHTHHSTLTSTNLDSPIQIYQSASTHTIPHSHPPIQIYQSRSTNPHPHLPLHTHIHHSYIGSQVRLSPQKGTHRLSAVQWLQFFKYPFRRAVTWLARGIAASNKIQRRPFSVTVQATRDVLP